MNDENLKAFISDIVTEINNRYSESQEEMKNNHNDLFISGRSLAYQEVYEIIKNRLDIYDITDE
jgi:hypothetical protein